MSATILDEFGRPMTAKEVAKALGVATGTVMRYWDQLGAFRLGGRTLFFENRVLEALRDGDKINQARGNEMGWPRGTQGNKEGATLQNKDGSLGLGSGNARLEDLGRTQLAAPSTDDNRHGLAVEQRLPGRRKGKENG